MSESPEIPSLPELPCRVDELLPGTFEAWAKLFHPLHEDLSLADSDEAWAEPWDEVYGRGRAEAPFAARGLKWHDLCEEIDLEYGPDLDLHDLAACFPEGRWPRRLVGPEDGALESETLHHLRRLLASFTLGACRYSWLREGSREADPAARLEAPLEEWHGLGRDARGAPCRVEALDGCWTLVQPEETAYALLAGPLALIASLERDKPLDGIRVLPELRIRAPGLD